MAPEIEMFIVQQSSSQQECRFDTDYAKQRGRKLIPRYWSGMSVGWLVLAIAIFYWGLHYRLLQYESAQRNHTAVRSASMWLGERSYVATPVGVHVQHGPQLTVLTAFLSLFFMSCSRVDSASENLGLRKTIPPPSHRYVYILFSRPPPAFSL